MRNCCGRRTERDLLNEPRSEDGPPRLLVALSESLAGRAAERHYDLGLKLLIIRNGDNMARTPATVGPTRVCLLHPSTRPPPAKQRVNQYDLTVLRRLTCWLMSSDKPANH